VLIVEDSSSMRHLLAESIARYPEAVIDEAADGLSAVIAIQRNASPPYDLILLDVNMPVIDGGKLLAKLRAQPAFSKTRVCIVTSDPHQATEDEMRALGADVYLRKPITRSDLEAAVTQLLGPPKSPTAPVD
jgi:two-component system chemotaxis response regulator CheY